MSVERANERRPTVYVNTAEIGRKDDDVTGLSYYVDIRVSACGSRAQWTSHIVEARTLVIATSTGPSRLPRCPDDRRVGGSACVPTARSVSAMISK